MNAEELESLKAIGYLSASSSSDLRSEELPDPRERIHDIRVLAEADGHLLRGRELLRQADSVESGGDLRAEARVEFAKAQALYAQLAELNPGNPTLPEQLGMTQFYLEEYDEALRSMEKAAGHRPHVPRVRYQLGQCYEKVGRSKDAVREMEIAIGLELNYPQAMEWLVWYYRKQADLARASWWGKRLLKVLPQGSPKYVELAQYITSIEYEIKRRNLQWSGPDVFPHEDLRFGIHGE